MTPGKCFSTDGGECDFGNGAAYFMATSLGKGDPPPALRTKDAGNFQRELPNDKKYRIVDVVQLAAGDLSTNFRFLELAWRLGTDSDQVPPLLVLPQTNSRPRNTDGPKSVAMGTCGALSVGRVEVEGLTLRLTSRCTPGALDVSKLKTSGHPFQWAVENDEASDILTKKVTVANWFLFPSTTHQYEDTKVHPLPRSNPVEIVVPGKGGIDLVRLSEEVKIAVTPPPAKAPSREAGRWTYYVLLVVVLAASTFTLVYAYKKGRLKRSLPFIKASSGAPAGTPGAEEPAGAGKGETSTTAKPHPGQSEPKQPEEGSSANEPPKQPAISRTDDEPPPPLGTNDDLTQEVRILRGRVEELETDYSELEGKVTAADLRVSQLLTGSDLDKQDQLALKAEIGQIKADLQEKAKATKGTREKVKSEVSQQIFPLQTKLTGMETRVADAETKLVRALKGNEDLQAGVGRYCEETWSKWLRQLGVGSTEVDKASGVETRPTIPVFPPESPVVVRRLLKLTDLANRILTVWMNSDDWNRDGTFAGFPYRFANEYQSLRNVAFQDQLLFRYWLGEIRYPENPALIESALRQWGLSGEKPKNVRSVSFTWAAERLPALQAIIEAAPIELEGDAQERLHRALSATVHTFGPLVPDKDASPKIVRLALSGVFHDLVKDLYREIGVEYYPVRLFEDSLQSEFLKSFLGDSRSAYRSDASTLLRQRGLVTAHGTIVRVVRPVVRVRDEAASKGYRWEGAIEYAEVNND
jgi:hypothetical protein